MKHLNDASQHFINHLALAGQAIHGLRKAYEDFMYLQPNGWELVNQRAVSFTIETTYKPLQVMPHLHHVATDKDFIGKAKPSLLVFHSDGVMAVVIAEPKPRDVVECISDCPMLYTVYCHDRKDNSRVCNFIKRMAANS